MSSPAQEKGLCRPSHPAWQPEDHKGIPPSTYSTPMTCSLYHPLGLGFSGLAYRQTRWFGIGLARGAQQDGPLAAIGQSWGPKVKSRGLEFDPCSSFTSKMAKHTHTHTQTPNWTNETTKKPSHQTIQHKTRRPTSSSQASWQCFQEPPTEFIKILPVDLNS